MSELDILNRVILFLENGIVPELETCYIQLKFNPESSELLNNIKCLINDLHDVCSGIQDANNDSFEDGSLPDYCSCCGIEFDEVDREYQICHICGFQNSTNNKQNNGNTKKTRIK
jgi:hypothetical protein